MTTATSTTTSGDIPLPPEPPTCDESPGADRPRSWQGVDPTDILDGTWQAPEPTVGRRNDGLGLFYPGKMHTVSSESEGGKTWFALCGARDELRRGNHVIYVDFEDDIGPIIGRLIALGAQRDQIRDYFHYLRPESPLTQLPNGSDLDDMLVRYEPTLAIVDGVTEAMTLHGLNPLDNADAARFGRMLPRRLASKGAAVANLDHVTKSADARGRYSIGAVHKLNGLDGAAYVLENRRPFGIGLNGVSTVRIAKDRPGALRKHALPGAAGVLHWFADLVLDSTIEGHTDALIVTPSEHAAADAGRPTVMMKRVADELTKHPDGLAQRVICDIVKGKTETKRTALSYLIADGYLTKTPHRLIKPYPDETAEQ